MTQHAESLAIIFSLGNDFRAEETDVATERCLHCLVPFPPLLRLGFSVALSCWDYVSLHTPLSSIHMRRGGEEGMERGVEKGGKRAGRFRWTWLCSSALLWICLFTHFTVKTHFSFIASLFFPPYFLLLLVFLASSVRSAFVLFGLGPLSSRCRACSPRLSH